MPRFSAQDGRPDPVVFDSFHGFIPAPGILARHDDDFVTHRQAFGHLVNRPRAAPRVIRIGDVVVVGKNNRPLLKEFTGEKISAINRVVVDMGNPLARTIAGRVQMAEQMLQMQLIKNPQEYFQVINTGKLDVVFE